MAVWLVDLIRGAAGRGRNLTMRKLPYRALACVSPALGVSPGSYPFSRMSAANIMCQYYACVQVLQGLARLRAACPWHRAGRNRAAGGGRHSPSLLSPHTGVSVALTGCARTDRCRHEPPSSRPPCRRRVRGGLLHHAVPSAKEVVADLHPAAHRPADGGADKPPVYSGKSSRDPEKVCCWY